MSEDHGAEWASGDATLVGRETAVDRALSLRSALHADRGREFVAPDEIAGRVLAEVVEAPADVPPRDYATMDGFAFATSDEYPLAVRDADVYPEDDVPSLAAGEAVRVSTGAPLPERTDVVLKREDASVEDEGASGDDSSELPQLTGPSLAPGTHVYERGSTVEAGETVFPADEVLSPKDAILLDDLGVDSVPVRDRGSVGVVATGTEIHEGEQPDRDSNMLVALASSWGHDATYAGSAPDEYERVRDLLASAAAEHDVVISTGGTSVGHKDFVVRALADLGDVVFQGVRIRPGRPVTVARLPSESAVAVALPGKPIAAHTAACLVARPLLAGTAELPTVSASATTDLDVPTPDAPGEKSGDAWDESGEREDESQMEYAVPVVLEHGRATPLGHPDSALSVYEETYDPSVLASATRATRADGVVLTETGFSAGKTVDVCPYDVLE